MKNNPIQNHWVFPLRLHPSPLIFKLMDEVSPVAGINLIKDPTGQSGP